MLFKGNDWQGEHEQRYSKRNIDALIYGFNAAYRQ